MKKIFAMLLCVLTIISFTACSEKTDDATVLKGDESDAFAMVEKYYKATGQLDIRTCMEAVFPESLEKQLEDYDGSIDKYVETVEKYMVGKEKIDITVTFVSIDRDKYSASADWEKETNSLVSVYGIDKSGIEKIVNLSFDLTYTENGVENTDRESTDVCKYKGNWYISPARADQVEDTEDVTEEISYPEALELAVNYVSGQVMRGKEVQIIDAPDQYAIMEEDENYNFFAIIDNDFYETMGGYPYQSLEIPGVSDNNYVIFTGKFELTDDNELMVTVTAMNNDESVLGNTSQIINVSVDKNSKKEGNAVKFKMK